MKLKLLFLSAAMTLASGNASAVFFHIGSGSIDGSLCVGNDCLENEAFGFDTIRLKENNLRIKAHDTSTVANYPDYHWQITFNDSANGGASKFSIDDISGNRTPFTVEANARSHSLYVDDGGRIGSRTSTPSVEIHTIDGDTPTLRLQQDGSSGFAPQTWDVAGNETNFFIRDVSRRLSGESGNRPELPRSVEQITQQVGRVPLKDLVRQSTDLVERLCIETALELTGYNRASAAELLVVSRQGLYAKLNRYHLGEKGAED